MGGGTIIINRSEILRTALGNSAFYDSLDDCSKEKANELLAKGLADWTAADIRDTLHLLHKACE